MTVINTFTRIYAHICQCQHVCMQVGLFVSVCACVSVCLIVSGLPAAAAVLCPLCQCGCASVYHIHLANLATTHSFSFFCRVPSHVFLKDNSNSKPWIHCSPGPCLLNNKHPLHHARLTAPANVRERCAIMMIDQGP